MVCSVSLRFTWPPRVLVEPRSKLDKKRLAISNQGHVATLLQSPRISFGHMQEKQRIPHVRHVKFTNYWHCHFIEGIFIAFFGLVCCLEKN